MALATLIQLTSAIINDEIDDKVDDDDDDDDHCLGIVATLSSDCACVDQQLGGAGVAVTLLLRDVTLAPH